MKKIITTAAAVGSAWLAQPAVGQVVLEANGVNVEDLWGGELGAGYRFGAGGFSITPSLGAFLYHKDNGRYYYYDNGNRDDACRDSATGQYADEDLCNNTAVKAYGRVEATYTIPLSLTFGVGARISNEIRPYGTVAVPIAPKVELKGNAGPHYYAAGLRLKF